MIESVNKSHLEQLNTLLKYFDVYIDDYDIIAKHPFSKWIVYILDEKIVGFLNFYIMYEQAELEYIYVSEDYRMNSIGFELMNFFIKEVKNANCNSITLEVNINNIAAINLYKKFGFKMVSIRKKYYNNDDALLMQRKLGD